MAKAMWMGFELELWASFYFWHLLAPIQFHGHTRGLGDFEMAWGGPDGGNRGTGSGHASRGCGFRWGPGREHLFLALDTATGRKRLGWGVGAV